ncbi:MAG: ATP-binding cassette domain-containing protein [Chlorobi bacterium]|nr:ATP-binding cassette domain-containing protein [Chlorobiota bacterium]
MIHAEGLHKQFATVHAVNGVTIQARQGEIFGLLGPNGAGKSTTIRMITNIIHPDSGSITYSGAPFSDSIRSSIGYLAEERGLYQKSRILETILHFAALRGVAPDTARRRAADWLRRFELSGSERRRVEELSKGNQQKVQLIIALIHQPQYIILDEPSSGLDPVNQELLRSILDQLRDDGRTILYSTHQMEQAERLCNRIALINKGKVVLAGTVQQVKEEHGGNNVAMEFEGDGRFLRGLPMVLDANIYPNGAELALQPAATLNDLLPHISGQLQITRIERVRPSLNSIFIQTVRRATGEAIPATNSNSITHSITNSTT